MFGYRIDYPNKFADANLFDFPAREVLSGCLKLYIKQFNGH